MKIVKSTGLVPVEALGVYGNFLPGTKFGLTPESALKARDRGDVKFLDTAGDEEIVEYQPPGGGEIVTTAPDEAQPPKQPSRPRQI